MKKSEIDLLNFFFLMFFSLFLLAISWILLENYYKEYKNLKERHLNFIIDQKQKILILNPRTFQYIDILCNSGKEEIIEDLQKSLKDFYYYMEITCLNGKKYEIKNKISKKEVDNKIFYFPDYTIYLTIYSKN